VRELVIDGKLIDDDSDCYVIAEIGHNHQGNLELCKRMFAAAAESGADAVKLQKRDNRSLYTDGFYNSPYNSENAFGATYGLHREALEFDRTQYIILQEYAATIGITFFATAFDIPSADFLAELEMPAIKIASGDCKNERLLEYVADLDIPIILSTGGCSMEDVIRADDICSPDAILQCTSGYPARHDELNIAVIDTFLDAFPDAVVGFSDHSNGIAMAPIAYALGARIIEKHFTLDRTLKGTDQPFSLEPAGLRKMVRDLRRAKVALGDGCKRCLDSERAPLAKQWKNKDGQIDGKCQVSLT
jgi:N-acetylneuraminate synthase/sialic acid synthase